MESLKPVLAEYLEVSKQLADLNARTKEVREHRATVELDLAAVYNEVTLPDKIELNTSRMTFMVKRPGQWKKGWTLSKKQMEDYLTDILGERGQEVMKEIVRRHEPKLVATDFAFDLKALE